jgi:hypothetical protein
MRWGLRELNPCRPSRRTGPSVRLNHSAKAAVVLSYCDTVISKYGPAAVMHSTVELEDEWSLELGKVLLT